MKPSLFLPIMVAASVLIGLTMSECTSEPCMICYTEFTIDWDLRNHLDSLKAIEENRPPEPVNKTGKDTTQMKGIFCPNQYPVQTVEAIGDSVYEQMKSNPIRGYIRTICLDKDIEEPREGFKE